MSRNKSSINAGFRRGAAAVEFAVVAPLFLLLLAGIIEFGQAFRIEHSLSNTARRAARSAIVDGKTSSQIVQQAKAQCAEALGIAEGDVIIELMINGDSGIELGQAAAGDEIRLTVSVPFSAAAAGFYAKMFSTATLRATCTLEHE